MKTISTLFAAVLVASAASAQTVWNFSNFTAGEMAPENTVINGMTLYNTSGTDSNGATKNYVFTVDSSKKTIDGTQYTQRLKSNGASMWNEDGTPRARVMEFEVSGPATITVAAASASKDATDRKVDIYVGGVKTETPAFSTVVASADPQIYTYNYTGTEATKILVSCSVGAINYYFVSYQAGSGNGGNGGNEGGNEGGEVTGGEVTWNISNWTSGEMAPTPQLINGMIAYNGSSVNAEGATVNYVFTVDGNNKTIDGTKYTQRLKCGGVSQWHEDGTPLGRVLAIKVNGASTIKVGAVSSSGSATDRCLDIYVGDVKKETADYSVAVDAKTPTTYTYNYTGTEPTTILIACSVGGINYYYISATNVDPYTQIPSAVEAIAADAADVDTVMYNVAGQKVDASYKGIVVKNGKKVLVK